MQGGEAHGRLVPRPEAQLRHQRTPAWSAGVGGDEDVGAPSRAVFDRYNIVEEDDLREAVKRIEAGTSGRGHDLVKVVGTGASNDEGPTS
jgi:hypothetical protein